MMKGLKIKVMQKKSFIQVNFAKFIEHQKLSIEYMKQV